MRPTWMRGAIVLEAILEPAFDRPVVAFFIHIDEIDDDQPGKVAQTQLAGNLLGGFEVGLERGCPRCGAPGSRAPN